MESFAVSTRDPDVAAATVRQMFGNPIRFESDPGRDFEFGVDGVVLDTGLTVATMSFPTAAALDSGELPDYTVSVMEGDIRWHGPDEVRRIAAPFIVPPGTAAHLRWSATRTLNVGLPADRLGSVTGGSIPSMAALNMPGVDARPLEALVRMVNAVMLSGPVVVENPLIPATAQEALVATIGATYPMIAAETKDRARPAALRRAVAYIEENLDRPVTVAEMAAAARMSVRGLQAAFRRELGVSPLRFLRQRRLAAARADLLASDEAGTVGLIARRWGFAHASRFAAEYHAAFGEYPATTLRGE